LEKAESVPVTSIEQVKEIDSETRIVAANISDKI